MFIYLTNTLLLFLPMPDDRLAKDGESDDMATDSRSGSRQLGCDTRSLRTIAFPGVHSFSISKIVAPRSVRERSQTRRGASRRNEETSMRKTLKDC